jgi:hypothetical protein
MFWNILNSLDSIQIISHDFITYSKGCHVEIFFKTCHISTIFILKHKNSNTSYTCCDSCSWAYTSFLSLFIFVPKDFNKYEHDIYLKKIQI